ncbi:uncharacterized protein LAJ45_11023 [Morchella importuna]|uniref:Uncharacterized protein n=1 Tax=Morchella conica CCBAS932 TaxID=1392247 RepID=A0A3N4LBE5_9PEZI|nr:uncharacterized protein LAJ45_11023 [Morchella importuna]KAH8145003.1 hypothetical protein LAJ45_11023 [Morchella importuna]RPB15325.1 hypothetical protein P167DRAFT_533127 [Morchella conica CCBAS932]
MASPPPPLPMSEQQQQKEEHQRAIDRIEKEQREIQEDIGRKRAEKATLQAVHDSLQKKESEKQQRQGGKK